MTDPSGLQATHDWAVETPSLRALELDFAVRCTDPAMGRYLAHVLSPFRVDAEPAQWWSVVVSQERNELSEIWVGEELSGRRRSPHRVVGHVLWRLNQEVIRLSSPRYVLVHASAAVHRGRALAFPASMESGKTTLVAGLIQRGFEYLTDEAVAIDPATLLVHPFPKALSIDAGSWHVLSGLRPQLAPDAHQFISTQWHVPVEDVRHGAVARPAPIDFFVFPNYDPHGPTALTAMRPAEAVIAIGQNSFNLRRHGRRGFDAVVEAVRHAECYRLTISDLDRACTLVTDLLKH